MNTQDITQVLGWLKGNRIMDRKKGATELRALLSDRDVCRQLDNSESRMASWDEIFLAATEYLKLEVDKLQKDMITKPNTRPSKIVDMRVCFSLVRTVVETADRNKQQLDREMLIAFFMDGLEGKKELASDFLIMLPKRVLSVPAYAEFLTDDQWRSLLSLVTKAYRRLGKDDKMSAAEALNAVVSKSSEYRNLVPLYEMVLFPFFKEALAIGSGIGNEPKLAAPLLSCLIKFSKLMTETCPYQLIALGEEVHETVIGCGSHCKALVVSYFRVLIAIRSSVGRNNPEEDVGWRSQLLGLRRFLVKDFDSSMVKGVLLGEKDPDLFVNWFSLTADVLHLIPVDSSGMDSTLNVTLSVTNGTMMGDDEPARKRVRLEERFDLANIAGKIRYYSKPDQLALLCTLIECLVLRHPSILGREEWLLICTELTKELVQKVGTLPARTLSTALRTLTSLLKILGSERQTSDDADSWWMNLCDQFVILSDKIFKSVVLSNSYAEGHLLLKMMVENDVLPRKPSPFQLFATANVPPTIEAARTLAALLKKFVLPGVIECPLGPTEYSRVGRSSREFFLEWLLRPGNEQQELWFERQPHVLGKLLAGLSLKNPRRIDFSLDDWWFDAWMDDNPVAATDGLRFLHGRGDRIDSSAVSRKKERPEVTQFTYNEDSLCLICTKLEEAMKSFPDGDDSSMMNASVTQNRSGSFTEKSPVAVPSSTRSKVALWFVVQHLQAATKCREGGAFAAVQDLLRSVSAALSRSIAASLRTWAGKFTEKFSRGVAGLEMGFRKSVEAMVALLDQFLSGLVEFKREYADIGVSYGVELIDALAALLDLRDEEVVALDPSQRHVLPQSSVDVRSGRVFTQATESQSQVPRTPSVTSQGNPKDMRALKIACAEVISALDAQTDEATINENASLRDTLEQVSGSLSAMWHGGTDLTMPFEILRACNIHMCGSLRITEELGAALADRLLSFCRYYVDEADDCHAMNKISLFAEKLVPFLMKLPVDSRAVNGFRKKTLVAFLQDITVGRYTWDSSSRLLRCAVTLYEHVAKQNIDPCELRDHLVLTCHVQLISNIYEGEDELRKSKRRITRMLAYREISAVFQSVMTNVEWRKVSDTLKEQLQLIATTAVSNQTSPAARADAMAVLRETVIAGYVSFGKASLAFRPFCVANLVLWAADNPDSKDEVDAALGKLNQELSYATRRGFVDIHIEAILRLWFAQKKTWKDLPVELLGWGTMRDFVGHYSSLLVVLSFELNAPSEITNLSEILEKQVPEVMKDAFPELHVRLALLNHGGGAGDAGGNGKAHLEAALKKIDESHGIAVLLEATTSRIVTAAYGSLDVISDCDLESWILRSLPPAIVSHGKKAGVKAVMKRMNLANPGGSSFDADPLDAVLRHRPEEMLRVLNGMYRELMRSEGSFERLTWAHRLSCLVEDLNLEKRKFPVPRQKEDPTRQNVQPAIDTQEEARKFPAAPVIGKFISSLVRHALSRAFEDDSGVWDEKAKDVLKSILRIESLRGTEAGSVPADTTNDAVANPDALEQALREDIVGRPLTLNLLRQLHDKLLLPGMGALKDLFLRLQKRGRVLSEDGGVLQALVKTLANVLADNSASVEMKTLAAKCLGLIGPGDLRTVVFDDSQSSLTSDAAQDVGTLKAPEAVYFRAFDVLLTHGLFSHNPDTIAVAIEALVNVFSRRRSQARKQVGEWQVRTDTRGNFSSLLTAFMHLGKGDDSSSVELGPRSYLLHQFASRATWSGADVTHEGWMRRIFESLLRSGLIKENHLLNNSVQFALESSSPIAMAKLFPFAIHASITLPSEAEMLANAQSSTARAVNNFLSIHCDMVDRGTASYMAAVDTRSLAVILDTIQTMRTIEYKPIDLKDNSQAVVQADALTFLRELDYFKAARAAQYCSAHLTSLMFLELACDKWMKSPGRATLDLSPEGYNPMGQMLQSDDGNGRELLKLLTEAYRNIGDVDGVHGCLRAAEFAEDDQAYAQALELSNDWSSLLAFSDRWNNTSGSVRALKGAGLYETMSGVLRSTSTSGENKSPDILGMRYEVAWRLGRWNDADELMLLDADNRESLSSLKNVTAESLMNQHLFEGFLSFMNRDKDAFSQHVRSALKAAADDQALKALEVCATVYPALGRMQAVLEFENVWKLTSLGTAKEAIAKWKIQDKIPSRFVDKEMTKAVRVVGLCSALNSLEYQSGLHGLLRQALCTTLLSMADAASKANRPEAALNALVSLFRHCGSTDEFSLIQAEGKMLEAKVCRMTKATDLGRKILKGLVDKLGSHPVHLAEVLTQYGEWMAELMAEPPSFTLDKLNQAIALLKTNLHDADSDSSESGRSVASTVSLDRSAVEERLAHAYLVLAKVADARYRQLTTLYNSDIFEEKRKRLKDELKLKEDLAAGRQRVAQLDVFVDMDEKQIRRVEGDRIDAMATAVRNYGESMRRSADRKQDLQIFRFVALWLEGKDIVKVLAEAGSMIRHLPSHKFISLLPQLGPRLAGGTYKASSFQSQLKELLARCVQEHPHHVLPVIVALSNGNVRGVDDKVELTPLDDSCGGSVVSTDATVQSKAGSVKPSPQKKDGTKNVQEDQSRVAGACQLLQSIVTNDPEANIAKHVNEMRNLCIQLIRLGNYGLESAGGKNLRGTKGFIAVPEHVVLPKDLQHTAVMSVPIGVGPIGSYGVPPRVHEYKTEFILVGGINSPKKIKCRGSDGVLYTELLKGNDDMRQDAVMQQVFRIINALFAASDDQEVTELQLGTYKVVPLSPRNGVLQWCESSEPLSLYLVGPDLKSGAHARLRPNDMPIADARDVMMKLHKCGTASQKISAFRDICSKLQPVFRHFMFETFRGPTKWYERRQAYTKSMAVSSIVGYVLGIGDRHVNNILIDKTTAEVIHIDFGIAFEKGLALPTPERVPFRLTRDMVDGMGVLAASGTFLRSCEKVMHALRHSAGEVVLTVLEVFLWDPLYEWDISLDKLNQMIDHETGKKMKDLSRKPKVSAAGPAVGDKKEPAKEGAKQNVLASRALGSVRDKLQGLVDGHLMSVSGQVTYVIQQARSAENMALIFHGWQPYI